MREGEQSCAINWPLKDFPNVYLMAFWWSEMQENSFSTALIAAPSFVLIH